MITKKYLIAAAVGLLVLAACKPTEDNYRSAYDKASEAARRKAVELSTGTDGMALESFDGPRVEVVDGDTILISPKRLKRFEGTEEAHAAATAGVAVAKYSMATNARRQIQDLLGAYPEAFIATDGDDNYYVIIATANSSQQAAPVLSTFKDTHPGYPYIGLPGCPLIFAIEP